MNTKVWLDILAWVLPVTVIAVVVLIGLQFGLQDETWWQAAKLQPSATVAADLLDSLVDFDALMRSQTFVDLPKVPTEE